MIGCVVCSGGLAAAAGSQFPWTQHRDTEPHKHFFCASRDIVHGLDMYMYIDIYVDMYICCMYMNSCLHVQVHVLRQLHVLRNIYNLNIARA